MSDPTYEDYVRDETFIADYLAYQERWARDVRESDRVLMGHVADAVAALRTAGRDPLVVDIGCSTGNLLRHLRAAMPDVQLADNASGFEDLNSYTVRAEDGRRLLFRGTLFQPWCHLVATKAS